MPYVKPKDRDSVWYIWNDLYRVRVPTQKSRSKLHLKHFGTFETGIKEIDRELHTELTDTMCTINQMVEFYRNGIVVRVVKIADCKKIYERVTDHLLAWKYHLERGMNIGDAPVEDFILMDNFADAVYPHARALMGNDITMSQFFRDLNGVMPVSRDKLLLPPSLKVTRHNVDPEEEKRLADEKKKEELKPQRKEMASFFTSYTRSASGERWR